MPHPVPPGSVPLKNPSPRAAVLQRRRTPAANRFPLSEAVRAALPRTVPAKIGLMSHLAGGAAVGQCSVGRRAVRVDGARPCTVLLRPVCVVRSVRYTPSITPGYSRSTGESQLVQW